MIPPPDRYKGERARVELDYEHAAARLLRILQSRHKYSDAQYAAAEAAERAAREARKAAYGGWYKELEEWADGIGRLATRNGSGTDGTDRRENAQ